MAPAGYDFTLTTELVIEGLPALTHVTAIYEPSGLLYAVAQRGLIYAIANAATLQGPEGTTVDLQEQPFLDISDRIKSGGEQGLLGLAFHPSYESNGRFFVNYTNKAGDTVVSEFSGGLSAEGVALADPASERILLTIDQPFANHNGGMIAFGRDGYLYIGMGDGGGGGDPMGAGQALGTLLGKMLRIDVNSGDPYGIPADNPLVAAGSGLPEIWSYGWRNPWRFSFDRATGDMFVGDVGQGAREEIDAEPARAGGRNYGWNTMEGELCYRTDPCDATGLTLPSVVNDRSRGECAITGGYVYRGSMFPDLVGAYVWSDYCVGILWAMDAATAVSSGAAEAFELGEIPIGPSSFGESFDGELYVVNLAGELHHVIAVPN